MNKLKNSSNDNNSSCWLPDELVDIYLLGEIPLKFIGVSKDFTRRAYDKFIFKLNAGLVCSSGDYIKTTNKYGMTVYCINAEHLFYNRYSILAKILKHGKRPNMNLFRSIINIKRFVEIKYNTLEMDIVSKLDLDCIMECFRVMVPHDASCMFDVLIKKSIANKKCVNMPGGFKLEHFNEIVCLTIDKLGNGDEKTFVQNSWSMQSIFLHTGVEFEVVLHEDYVKQPHRILMPIGVEYRLSTYGMKTATAIYHIFKKSCELYPIRLINTPCLYDEKLYAVGTRMVEYRDKINPQWVEYFKNECKNNLTQMH